MATCLGFIFCHTVDAVSLPVPTYGPGGSGFANIFTEEQGKSGDLIELQDGSQIILSVDYQITPYVGTKMVLTKLTPSGLPDTAWQQAGRRELPIVGGPILTREFGVRVALVATLTGYLIIHPNQSLPGGVFLYAIDSSGNDANVFGGLPNKLVVIPNIGSTQFISSFTVLNDHGMHRILVEGRYAIVGGDVINFVGAIGYDGNAITTFGNQGFVLEPSTPNEATWSDIALSSNGIFVAGTRTLNGDVDFAVTKLDLMTGVPDQNFGPNGTKQLIRTGLEKDTHVILRPEGIVLIGGREPDVNETPSNVNCCSMNRYSQTTVARVFYNGAMDLSFGSGGWVDIQNPEYMGITDIAIRFDGTKSFGSLVFSAVGVINDGIAGNLEIGTLSATMHSLSPVAQCGAFGNEWPSSIHVGLSGLFVTGTNQCTGNIRPVVSKHSVQ